MESLPRAAEGVIAVKGGPTSVRFIIKHRLSNNDKPAQVYGRKRSQGQAQVGNGRKQSAEATKFKG